MAKNEELPEAPELVAGGEEEETGPEWCIGNSSNSA